MRFATNSLAVAFVAAGCAAGPDFHRPDPPAVASYLPEQDAAALGRQIPARWWGLFHSPALDQLLHEVIARSRTLVAAKATLAQAQELVRQARGGLYPSIDLAAGARGATAGIDSNLFSVGANASYSLDVFGGTRRRIEQQEALEQQQRCEVAAAWLALTGNSVVEAVAVASVRLQIATLEDLIRNDERTVDLVRREFEAGKVAKTDVLTAAAQLASDRTQLPALRQQLAVARHALTILAGHAPGNWTPPDIDLAELTLPAQVPLSLPSQLVRQRPDILAAEALLHAQSAAVGVAEAQLYPSITLSGSFLRTALSLPELFGSAAIDVLSGSGSLAAPIFHGGALQAQRSAAVDAYNGQLATYEQTILQAFGQVADALTAVGNDADLVAASRYAVDIASQSLALQKNAFAAGKTSALQLIVAENTYSQIRLGYARALGQQMTDAAQLVVAVGGGWWENDVFEAGRRERSAE